MALRGPCVFSEDIAEDGYVHRRVKGSLCASLLVGRTLCVFPAGDTRYATRDFSVRLRHDRRGPKIAAHSSSMSSCASPPRVSGMRVSPTSRMPCAPARFSPPSLVLITLSRKPAAQAQSSVATTARRGPNFYAESRCEFETATCKLRRKRRSRARSQTSSSAIAIASRNCNHE